LQEEAAATVKNNRSYVKQMLGSGGDSWMKEYGYSGKGAANGHTTQSTDMPQSQPLAVRKKSNLLTRGVTYEEWLEIKDEFLRDHPLEINK
jgi:hypothetical protein